MMLYLYPLIGAFFFYRRANAVNKFGLPYGVVGYVVSSILVRAAFYCNSHFIRDHQISIMLFWSAIILSIILPYFVLKPKPKSRSFKELD